MRAEGEPASAPAGVSESVPVGADAIEELLTFMSGAGV
jgi:hypothetical protein